MAKRYPSDSSNSPFFCQIGSSVILFGGMSIDDQIHCLNDDDGVLAKYLARRDRGFKHPLRTRGRTIFLTVHTLDRGFKMFAHMSSFTTPQDRGPLDNKRLANRCGKDNN